MDTDTNGLDIRTLQKDYIPVIYKVPDLENDIYTTKLDPIFTKGMSYPKFTYGFHHFIHQSKGNMKVTDQFEGKKKVYYVMSKFEKYIDDYDQDLAHISRVYFDIDPKPDIICRAFFKIWEIYMLFDLINLDKSNFISAHLAEGPGSFIQATMLYRDKFCKKGLSKDDKFYGITLHPENTNNDNKSESAALPLEANFIKFYEKEKPIRFTQHKTYSKNEANKSSSKDNGDLTDLKTIKLFSEHFSKNKANLVTADGGFIWQNENLQEQEAFPLILGEIITALNIQEKGGKFVLKIYESFTDLTVKLISILKSFYKNIYIIKPLTSRKSNSEKYVVCDGYHGYNDKKVKVLEDLLAKINNTDLKVNNIFPDYELSKEFMLTMISSNTYVANRQFQSMNEIIDFINKQNYRGDEYQNRRKMQIDATKYWIKNFFPDLKDFNQNKKSLESFTTSIITNNTNNAEKLGPKLKL